MFNLPFLFLRIALKASIAYWESIRESTERSKEVVVKTTRNALQILRAFLRETYAKHIKGNLYKIERGFQFATKEKQPHLAVVIQMPRRCA